VVEASGEEGAPVEEADVFGPPPVYPAALDFSAIADASEDFGVALQRAWAPLLEDPGFERWFEGVIRVERGDEVLFSIERGVDVGGAPLDQDSIFWVGSISKTFCSTAVLQLVEEGKLGLDDPIGTHLPGWEPTDATIDGEACTVARLLSHECGFPRDAPTSRMVTLQDPLRNEAARAPYLEEARKLSLSFTPGSDNAYSNIGYNLAGLLVMAKDTGSYDEILQRRLFAPLGLERTGTEPARVSDFFERVAPMTLNLGRTSLSATTWLGLPEDAPSRMGAAGHAFSTPAELTRFFEALFQAELLESETLEEMVRPRETDKGYGLGIALRDRDGTAEYWHNGALSPHGFSAHVSTFPTWNTTVTVLVARGLMVTPATGVAQRLIDALLAKEYRSPFPAGVGDLLIANLIGIVFVLAPLWMWVALGLAAFRPVRKPRVAWALGVCNNACGLILIRGILGKFGDGIDVWFWPISVCCVAAGIIWYRLKNDHTQPLLAEHSARWRRAFAWMGLLLTGVFVLVYGWVLVGTLPHFTALLGFAIWRAIKRPAPAS
jgi:D-alanyl-D-alanine carboxypeptidase